MGRHLVTDDEYSELFNAQAGVCAICATPPGERKLAVDHDHGSGEVRGLLCTRCNLGLGYFKDEARRLLDAYHYLMGAAPGKDALVGKWFLTLVPREDYGGELGPQWQGQIVGRTASGNYLAQLYSWWDGSPTNFEVIDGATIEGDRWELFATDEDMRDRSERHYWPIGERYMRQQGVGVRA